MTDTKISVQTSAYVEDNVSGDILSKLDTYLSYIFYGSDWDITRYYGRDITDAYTGTNRDAACGESGYQLWDWMQDNQISSGVDLLVIYGPRWANDSPGCGGGSSAYVSVDDDSIANVADPGTGNSYLIGDGTEEKGEKEISTALMEAGHCWGCEHDDGISHADNDDDRDCVSPMMGNYADDKAGSYNNCGDQIRHYGWSNQRRYCAYTDCAAQSIPSSDGVRHYSRSFLIDQT